MPNTKTLLVVDDDSLVLESILLLLAAVDGFQTVGARGAADATVHLHGSRTIDVLVADVVLAGPTTGLDLCRIALETHPDIAIVVITADSDVHPAETPARGVFLRKPFGAEMLLAAIEQAVTQASAASSTAH
jgi:DNA-binding NtrC family response regulator